MDKTSLGFQKPKEEEYYDINIFNQNAQLSNDLIEKNSSAIGQKLDKDSSFYADLEAYYGNTKLIDDFQDIGKWTAQVGTKSSDTTNVKIGNQSIKLLSTAVGLTSLKIDNINLDLTRLNNGEISTDDDYVYAVLFISDIGKVTQNTNAVTIRFSQDSTYSDTNSKIFQDGKGFNTSELKTGWNFLKLKKSAALTLGTGSWENIKSIFVGFVASSIGDVYVSFQLIQLVKKDPLEDKPNPFQKFGVRDFEILNGEWFVGKDFGELKIKELKGYTSYMGIRSVKNFKDFILNATKVIKNSTAEYHTVWTDIDSNYKVACFATLQVLVLRVFEPDLKEYSIPLSGFNVGSTITYTLEKSSNKLKLTARIGSSDVFIIEKDTLIPSTVEGALSFGASSNLTCDILSASITEISHAHHADVAENLSENGKLDLLRTPKTISISSGTNKIMQLGFFNYAESKRFNLYAKIMRPNLHNGSQLSYADLFLGKYSSSFSVEGKLQMNIDLSTQQYKLRFVVTDTGKLYAISPLYNYSDWIIIENKNFTEDIREVSAIDGNIIWDSDNNTDKIALQQTPVETVITTGFASGWSGTLRYSKTQEGKVNVHGRVTKSGDINNTVSDILYTLPVGYRPNEIYQRNINCNTSAGSLLKDTFCRVFIDELGRLAVLPSTTLTSNSRFLIFDFEYTARN